MDLIPFNILKQKLNDLKHPTEPIQLSPGETTNNIKLFLKTHIRIVDSNPGNRAGLPYYNRLLRYYYFMQNFK